MSEEKREFHGLDEKDDYLQTVMTVEGGTLSPGGAASLLRMSREGIWQLIRRGQVRTWMYFDGRTKQPAMIDVSIRDLVRHGVRTGRIKSYADVGYGAEVVRREVDLALSIDIAEQTLID